MTKEQINETASWILVRMYENDPNLKNTELSTSEINLYVEGWGEDHPQEVIDRVTELHYGK